MVGDDWTESIGGAGVIVRGNVLGRSTGLAAAVSSSNDGLKGLVSVFPAFPPTLKARSSETTIEGAGLL